MDNPIGTFLIEKGRDYIIVGFHHELQNTIEPNLYHYNKVMYKKVSQAQVPEKHASKYCKAFTYQKIA